ncbi:AEC family transporter [Ruminococcus sp.]|uniref:AEC family transporter n=1 Tax=Ruminococcus sp. TaxID=41978 RepID=UPI0025CDC1F7|nr:AEC family transporter [Ruminococcus sp.]MBQ8967420.1 AEC family transporter [Ruminococcus sp.]
MTDAFLFAANAVLPIVFLILLGYILKRRGMLTAPFLDVGNKLTFRVLLPVMLFCNVYKIEHLGDVNIAFVLYGMTAVFLIFLAAVVICCAFTKESAKRGSLIQAVFRSNYAIIGIPLAAALFGDKGAAAAGVMSAFCVPLFNILGVVTLVMFNGSEQKQKADVRKMITGVLKNPLILGTFAGLAALGIRSIFEHLGIAFRLSDITPLFKTLENIKSVCTPFALIVLGGKFEFSAVSRLKKEIIFGTAVRTVAVPVIGIGTALLLRDMLGLSGEHFAVYMGVFGTPVAVASAIMAKEMGADDELAGQLVVWTSLVSTVTIFIYVTLLRMLGVF